MKAGGTSQEDLNGLKIAEEALRGLKKEVPPEGLASAITSRLAHLPPPRRPAWRVFWEALQRPQVVWAYRMAIFLVLLGTMAGVWRLGNRSRPAAGHGSPVHTTAQAASQPKTIEGPMIPVTFTFYAPKAQSVCVVSTFNDWNPLKTPMNRGKDGTWSVQVSLPQGRYEYMFLVDGARYETDPNAIELRQDGMGNDNAVLRL
jgi:hypothetical protein